MAIRVFIAEDHALFREGTRRMLEQEPDIAVVGEAEDGLEAVKGVLLLQPDVAVLDIRMPGLNGVEATSQIRQGAANTAVLILSAYDDDVYVRALMEAGATGYLLKTVRAADLADAVRRVHAGETVLHPDIARKLVRLLSSGPDPDPGRLTAKETDVLRLLCRGLRNKEIASELTLSVKTVEGHLEAIYGKLGLRSRTEVVLYASSRGWFSGDEAQR
jgi:DNA-binding NarL/FixJ family response regulator